jgi:tetratricopeptide (TPR) repeat protein
MQHLCFGANPAMVMAFVAAVGWFALLSDSTLAQDPAPVVDPLANETSVAEPEVDEPASPPGADLSEATALIRANDLEGAEQVLAAQHDEFPDDPALLLLHGEVLLALGRFEEALPLLQRASELDGDRPRVHFQLATALKETGDVEGALAAFLREAEVNENPGVQRMARLNRMVLLSADRKWAAAAAELEEVLVLDPTNANDYGELATLYLQAGQPERAADALTRGLTQGFRSARHHYAVGTRFHEKEAYDKAIGAYRTAIEIDPTLAEAERSLAVALDLTERGDEALAHFRRYLELKPEAPDAERVSQRISELQGG